MPSVQHVRWAKGRIAAVVLVAGIILGTFLWLLTGGRIFEEQSSLYMYMSDSTGLAPGSIVRVDGITVGKVRSVAFANSHDPNRVVRVRMNVDRDQMPRIPADSYAEAGSENMVGDKFVDVTSGTSRKTVKPNDEIAFRAEPDFIKSLDMAGFDRLVHATDAMLSDIEHGKGRVGQFIMGEDVYRDLLKRAGGLERGIRDARDATTQVGRFLNTDRDYQRIAGPLRELESALAKLQAGEGAAGRFLRDPAQYEDLRKALAGIHGAAAKLRASDWFASDAEYADWNKRLAGLIQSVQAFQEGPMLSSSQLYDSLNGAARELRDAIEDIRENPKKYLRMQVF